MLLPDRTRESYEAAGRMGAGIVECEVVFTKDKEFVCRHVRTDLHARTNVLAIPDLKAKCSAPFSQAIFDTARLTRSDAA